MTAATNSKEVHADIQPSDLAYACKCGSVRFHYRMDSKLECQDCHKAAPVSKIPLAVFPMAHRQGD